LTLDAPCIRFLGYRLDPVARTLTAPDGSDVTLHGRAFDVLVYLIEHRPRVIGKDELLAAVWPGRVVEENNLGQAISALRRVLGTGAGAGDHRFIRTVQGRGYSFVAAVEPEPTVAPASADALPAAVRPTPWRRPAQIAGALIALAGLLGAWAWHEHATSEAVEATPATVAVLPFGSLDGDPHDRALGLGIAETVITRLSRATSLQVLSLSSTQAMGGKAIDPKQAGATLGADFVLDGHLQHHGDAVRITARLQEARRGRTLWAGTYDRNEQNVFSVQDTIAASVASALSHPYRAPGRTSGCQGADPVAYRAYLRGYFLINRPDPQTIEQADAAFHEALARDPQCARALAGISGAARLRVMVSDGDPEVEFPRAQAAVAAALAIDPDSADAYTEQGALQFWYHWNWPAAEAALQHAIELDPNLVHAHILLAHLYANLELYDRAAAEARIAVTLDPLSPIVNALAAEFVAPSGRRREANLHLDSALELEPDFWMALVLRSERSLSRGDRQAADRDMQHAVAQAGRSTRSLVFLANYDVASGRPELAREVLAELEARRTHGRYVLPSCLAQVHLALGEKRQALDLLEQGYQHSDVGMAFLDTWFGALADEPRYTTLLRALRLPPPAGDAPAAPSPRKQGSAAIPGRSAQPSAARIHSAHAASPGHAAEHGVSASSRAQGSTWIRLPLTDPQSSTRTLSSTLRMCASTSPVRLSPNSETSMLVM
jgi:serine/threonine-protein kinase